MEFEGSGTLTVFGGRKLFQLDLMVCREKIFQNYYQCLKWASTHRYSVLDLIIFVHMSTLTSYCITPPPGESRSFIGQCVQKVTDSDAQSEDAWLLLEP